MKTPNITLILETADQKYNGRTFTKSKIEEALQRLENCLSQGEIRNQEFIACKQQVSRACEHAQHVAADSCRPKGGRHYDDARNNIGYAFQMNQAAKLSRELKKLPEGKLTPNMHKYVDTLDQINGLFLYLKEFKSIIVKGRKPSENPKEVDETNTGICTVCMGRFKLKKNQKMVHHGFTISAGWGQYFGCRIGGCFGCKYLPYEFSCEGNKEWIKILNDRVAVLQNDLADLKAEPESFVYVDNVIKKGEPFYETKLGHQILRVETDIRFINDEIKVHEKLIKEWKLKPLKDGTTKK